MIKLAFQVLVGLLLSISAIWVTAQLARNRHDLPLRVMAPGLLCLAFAATAGIPGLAREPLKHLLGHGLSDAINGCWFTITYCFAMFFIMADDQIPEDTRKRRALLALIPLVFVVATMVLINEFAPYDSATRFDTWQNIVLDVIWGSYTLIYRYLGFRRALRYLRTLENRWLQWSVSLVIAGIAFMTIGVDMGSLLIDTLHAVLDNEPRRFDALIPVYTVGLLAGQGVLAIAFILPVIGAAVFRARAGVDRRLQGRYNLRLAPLWLLLTREFPFITRQADDQAPDSSRRHAGIPAFADSLSEVTDGLAFLAPYYLAGGFEPAAATDGVTDPKRAAWVVQGALQARAAEQVGDETRSQPPYPRLVPEFRDWRDMAGWLVQLAEELYRLDPVRQAAA